MNNRVRKYTPLLSPPQTQRPPCLTTRTYGRSWRDYLSQEVDDHYHFLTQQRQRQSVKASQEQLKVNRQKSTLTVYSPSESYLSRSDFKSQSTQLELNTPIKDGKLNIHNYSTLSTTINKTPKRAQVEQESSYRMQLIEEECTYLRKKFIAHCLKHHREQLLN